MSSRPHSRSDLHIQIQFDQARCFVLLYRVRRTTAESDWRCSTCSEDESISEIFQLCRSMRSSGMFVTLPADPWRPESICSGVPVGTTQPPETAACGDKLIRRA